MARGCDSGAGAQGAESAPPTSAISVPQQEFAGTGVRLIQVVVRGSDFDRGFAVSEDEYQALPAGERGATVYHKLQRDGRLTEVAAADYAQLPVDQQGAVEHYRWERPPPARGTRATTR